MTITKTTDAGYTCVEVNGNYYMTIARKIGGAFVVCGYYAPKW